MVHEQVPDVELSNEYKLLLLCARTRMTDWIGEEIKFSIQQEINWDYLLQISAKHRLTPLLYWQLNYMYPDSVPLEVIGRLKTHFNENARKNLLFMGTLKSILELFKSYNITAIPYKGPFLAVLTYKNLALRQFDDIDIYIQKQDIQKALNIMILQGYEILSDQKREYVLINKENGVKVEIKWKFPVLSYYFPVSSDHFCEHVKIEKIEFNGFEIHSPSNEDMLLILCIHNAGHLWARLSWICDIAEFVQNNKDIDWEKVIERATELRIVRILLINLILARDMFGINISKEISDINTDPSLEKIVTNTKRRIFPEFYGSPNIFKDVMLRLSIRENIIDQIKDFSRLIINHWKID